MANTKESFYYTIDFGVNWGNVNKQSDAEIDRLVNQAWNQGVDKIVLISNHMQEAIRNSELSDKYSQFYYTIGVHPHNAKHFKDADITIIADNLKMRKCFGIGECGLDYSRMFSSKDAQIYAFEQQVMLAKQENAKLYLHCRDAYDDFIGILKKYNYFNGIVHCFTGDIDQALELTSLGFKLGITGWLLDKRRNKDLVNAIKDPRISLSSLIVETDAPWMPIYPNRQSNPGDTFYIVDEIAKIKGIDPLECGKILYQNALDMLNKN